MDAHHQFLPLNSETGREQGLPVLQWVTVTCA